MFGVFHWDKAIITMIAAILAGIVFGNGLPENYPPENLDSSKLESRIIAWQWGIVVDGKIAKDALPALPEFVHRKKTDSTFEKPLLIHSALYFTPPLRTTGTLALNANLQIPGGNVFTWYPYAAVVSNNAVQWNDVYLNRLAEGPKMSNELWGISRKAKSSATTFVERPGEPGTQPGDLGTTEGEVFLSMSGELGTSLPLKARNENGKITVYSFPTAEKIAPEYAHTWCIQKKDERDFQSHRIILSTENSSAIWDSTTSPSLSGGPDQFAFEISEALVGNGLDPDLAHAETLSLVKMLETNPTRELLVFLLPDTWTDKALPLNLQGNAAVQKRSFVGVIPISE